MQLDTTWIRQQREQNAWSQEYLAQASGLGLRTIQRIESSGVASAESALAIAAVFEVSVLEITAKREAPTKQRRLPRLALVTALLSSCFVVLFIVRAAVAEQIELAIGVSVDGAEIEQQSMLIREGNTTAQKFGNKVQTVVTPETIEIAGKEVLAISLRIFQETSTGEQMLIESPELLFQDGANWEINVHNTPTGKSYRLLVQAHEVSG